MSALPPKADMCSARGHAQCNGNVCFGPIADNVPILVNEIGNHFRALAKRQRPGKIPAADSLFTVIAIQRLRLDDGDDLVCARIDDHDLVTHQDVIVAAPLGINHDHLLR